MRFCIRQLIFVVLLMAMPVAAYVMVFNPRNEQIAAARHEIQLKQSKLTQLEKATRSISDLGQEIDKLSDVIALFEQKLPAEREVEVILHQVWKLAARHQLTLKSIRTDKPVIANQYAELPIKVIIVGNFDGFYSFLIDLEKLRRITRMPRMKLIRDKKKDGQMQAEILLSIFYESKVAALPSRASAGGA